MKYLSSRGGMAPVTFSEILLEGLAPDVTVLAARFDNLREGVKPWTASPYRFVKRQSQTDPSLWVSVGEPGGSSPPVVASR